MKLSEVNIPEIQNIVMELEKAQRINSTTAMDMRAALRVLAEEKLTENKVYDVAQAIFYRLNEVPNIIIQHSRFSSERVSGFSELGAEAQQPFKDAAKIAIALGKEKNL